MRVCRTCGAVGLCGPCARAMAERQRTAVLEEAARAEREREAGRG